MTQPDLLSRPDHDFKPFWKRWRGPVEGRLANANEGRHEAEMVWNRLSVEHKLLAHEWGPHFQKEFKRANGDDCAMLHCCRYLSKKRFLNYEDDEPQGQVVKLVPGDDGYAEWLEYKVLKSTNPFARDYWEKQDGIYTTTPFPPQDTERTST